jgi:putative transposase
MLPQAIPFAPTAANRVRERIQNLIKDLHNKAVNLLANSYKVIYLPTFDSSQMVIRACRKEI